MPFSPILAYRWTGEFALGIFIAIAATVTLGSRQRPNLSLASRQELIFIFLPLLLLVFWSFASLTWSTSWRGAAHHSLLWACYFLFFFLIRSSTSVENPSHCVLKVLGSVLLIISLACLVEYVLSPFPRTKVFNERFYPSAEIMATLLPLFIALSFRSERKWARLAILVGGLSWALIVCTTSRTMLIAGLVGIGSFVGSVWLIPRRFESRRMLLTTLVIFLAVALLLQVPYRSGEYSSTLTRLAEVDDSSALSTRSRLLMWGLAMEGFRSSPYAGIGADNYFAEYKMLRELLSSRDPNNPVLEVNEDLFPERAHNEYLQILAELGIVGGLLFGWLLAGIAYLFWLAFKKKASLLTIGALSGVAAFLVASGASSYSFRLPANGMCFFFLLSVASSELFGSNEERPGPASKLVRVIGVVVAVTMIAFSLVRANSIRHMTNALNAKDESIRKAEIENAISIDPSEPMFRFYYGQWLERSGDHDSAIAQMRIAIDNGLADSPSFFRLAAAQLNAGRPGDAAETYAEALRVYPRSVFLRTAFSSFLKKRGDNARATAEYDSALSINEKQARSWQLAHDEGLETLVKTARVDNRYVSTFELKPESAPLVLSNFQDRAAEVLP